ncbi:ABC-type multidrug transport system permease subunit [Duganella sp. 3397]|uniref:hypothetical protein n=1 Tax=Duganella sp. 3397 TaxID=2817732 RepID=UPI002855BE1C|nr:hypothetical protein [Duganella sp. 3397]MDR7047614.1 ABC-type multidrug transport system permease subunit [Duganella sp. 3397]
MQEFEKWLARVLLLNSALALAVSLGLLGPQQAGGALAVVFGVAMLGFLAAVLSLRRMISGLIGGIFYYLPQVGSYFPYDGSWQFSVKAGVSLGLVARFGHGVFVLNVVALVLLAATATVLVWRLRHRPFSQAPSAR